MTTAFDLEDRCATCGRRFGAHHEANGEFTCDAPSERTAKRFVLQKFDYGIEEVSVYSLIEPYEVPLAR